MTAHLFLDASGDTGEGRALQRLVNAIVLGEGAFSESDIASFSSPALDLAAALIEARMEGRYTDKEWAQLAI